jgi:hypothetical protein
MNLTGNLKNGASLFNYGNGPKSGFGPYNNSQAFSVNSSKNIICCPIFKGGAKALNDTNSLKTLYNKIPNSGDHFSPSAIDRSIKRTGKDVLVNSFYNNSPCYTNFMGD